VSYRTKRLYSGESSSDTFSWTTLGTLNTNRTGQTTKNVLDNQLVGLMKNGPSYYVLASDFEKKPLTCTVSSEKQNVEAGEEIEVTISSFRDSNGRPSREFNRIIIYASEGEILNGEKSELGSQYKVFRLDEVPIKVKYKAPQHSVAPSASIAVYNSCDIIPAEKLPLRKTTRGNQIASYDLLLKHFDWVGNISISVTMRFNCNTGRRSRY
jgi:hypothetical protein